MKTFKIVRLPFMRYVIGWVFGNVSNLLPVDRIFETENLLAFFHPEPSYPVHILLVPKHAIPTLSDLDAEDEPIFRDVLVCVKVLVSKLDLDDRGYRLVLNGGKYQDVPQLHFHLISE